VSNDLLIKRKRFLTDVKTQYLKSIMQSEKALCEGNIVHEAISESSRMDEMNLR
jgi:hypothetical protein